MEQKDIEAEIIKIKKRNKKVELDKAWERSTTRGLTLTVLTYLLVVILLLVIKNEHPFTNALIPTLGYFLSFQSLSFLKKLWKKNKKTHL